MSDYTENFIESRKALRGGKDSGNSLEGGAPSHVEGFLFQQRQPPTSGYVPPSSPAVAHVDAPGNDNDSPIRQCQLIFTFGSPSAMRSGYGSQPYSPPPRLYLAPSASPSHSPVRWGAPRSGRFGPSPGHWSDTTPRFDSWPVQPSYGATCWIGTHQLGSPWCAPTWLSFGGHRLRPRTVYGLVKPGQ